ncbi:hypothetical protein A3J77_02165 [Candidatus Wolfebacteria bacterium RBG_13_41_7]|uniref:Uncharacterized protein n=1 Tax=Candidatus Wolfebacteria bacterium RBG_13_41_7 TaxID=1802554 RepID=A0A1F8DPW5_9BACT|nr:MAG: hypothetical protein A3J77_02165 [Candidatus Wolfebacteria bacterium RBG_13_41_7]
MARKSEVVKCHIVDGPSNWDLILTLFAPALKDEMELRTRTPRIKFKVYQEDRNDTSVIYIDSIYRLKRCDDEGKKWEFDGFTVIYAGDLQIFGDVDVSEGLFDITGHYSVKTRKGLIEVKPSKLSS